MPAQQGTGWREIWRERLLEFLRGSALGDVPASAGSPPLVEDARRRALSHRIDLSDGASRRRRLDIRRKRSHLAASRYLHAMTLLNSDFAEMRSGPDYLHGIRTDLLFEEWSYAWSPRVEGRLIELAARASPGTLLQRVLRCRRDRVRSARRWSFCRHGSFEVEEQKLAVMSRVDDDFRLVDDCGPVALPQLVAIEPHDTSRDM